MVELEIRIIKFNKRLRFFPFSLAMVLCGLSGFAQPFDSLPSKDSSIVKTTLAVDTLPKPVDSTIIKNFLLTQQILQTHPYFNYAEKATVIPYAQKKKPQGKELYFYVLAGILLIFAVFKTLFDKYFSDLMTLFFRRSLKQRQLSQQVSQNSLPSLLFNILFVVVTGFYLALLIKEIGSAAYPFRELLLYAIAFVSLVYGVKFLLLKLVAWMFNLKILVNSYIFIVFLVNKITGIVLLPVIVIMALGNIELRTVILTLSWIALGGLLFYRFVQAFGLLRKEKSINAFHFILYLLAFEILPVLVIYKAIGQYL